MEPLGSLVCPVLVGRDDLLGAIERAAGGGRVHGRPGRRLPARHRGGRRRVPRPRPLARPDARRARRGDALGSRSLAEATDSLARRVRARASVDAPWAPLSSRELEVARLIADGLTNPVIAARLGISPTTVTAHVEHILDKLGATRRAEVAAWVAGASARGGAPRQAHSTRTATGG